MMQIQGIEQCTIDLVHNVNSLFLYKFSWIFFFSNFAISYESYAGILLECITPFFSPSIPEGVFPCCFNNTPPHLLIYK